MKRSRWIPIRAVRWSLFLFASLPILLSACTGARSTPGPLPATSTPLVPTAAAVIPETGTQPTQPAADGCPPTPLETRADQPLTLRPTNGVTETGAPGERLIITGTIYDRGCRPVPGMSLRFWQTDAEGIYGPGHGTDSMVCCYYGGETVTDGQGRYTILTIMPAAYEGEASPPPAHVHIEGEHPSGARLASEIVFEGDPYLGGGYNVPPPISLQAGSDEQGPTLLGAADFVLTQDVASDAALAIPAAEGFQTFQILPGESSVSYQIRERFADIAEMVSPVGVTTGVEGEIQLDLGEPPALRGMSVTVDLRSLTTDDPKRDEKLWDRWLVMNSFPFATFTASGIQGGPAAYQAGQAVSFSLSGDLTIRDVTRPVDFLVTASLEGDRLTGEAETKILMSDFGIDPPNLLGFVKVEDEVTVRVDLVAERAEP